MHKEKALNRIDLNEFLTGDKRHKQSDEIFAKLEEVVGKLVIYIFILLYISKHSLKEESTERTRCVTQLSGVRT